ncbi:MAG TPA: hypothetical protein VEA37_10155 [Flavobacterium sp.]|nr:hypothetical protein [Flavobacterium sp.]
MYIKQYDSNGLVANPITKEQPFINVGKSRRERRFTQRKSNNRKGDGLVVFGRLKYRIVKQVTPPFQIIGEAAPNGGTQYRVIKRKPHLIVHSVLVN